MVQLKRKKIDELLAAQATLVFDGTTLYFTYPDGRTHVTKACVGGRGQAAKWVNVYNEHLREEAP